ncbi:MAG: phosphoserine phosphatase SerB [Pseudomonadota bacterium]
MFVAVLIASPSGLPLEKSAAEALRNAWGGGDITWRAPDRAAEFPLDVIPDTHWSVWAELQHLGVDLCVVPQANRRKRLLIADMDSTMIDQECIDELADVARVGDRVREITSRAMNGELDFEAALEARVSLLEGLDAGVIDTVLRDRITEARGGRTLLATMKAHGAWTLLVSGGFTAFSAVVAQWIGFDAHQANVLEVAERRLTGKVTAPILGREAKVEALERATAAQGIGTEDVVAVGDGANDLGMLGRAGMGIALHAKPAVAEACGLRINHGDLTALLYLQGYSADAFVRSDAAAV